MFINNLLKTIILLFFSIQITIFASITTPKSNVLVLQDFFHLPRTKEFSLGLYEIQKKYNYSFIFHVEYMHPNVKLGVLTYDAWKEYLLKKYKNIKIDAIISSSPDSSFFLEKYEKIFGNIPLIVMNKQEDSFSNPVLSYKTNIHEAIEQTVELALFQNPNTKKAMLITNNQNGHILLKLSTLLKERNIEFKYINVNSIKDITKKISEIDRNTILFYEPVFKDLNNTKIIPKHLLVDLARNSSAPIYTFWSPLIDTGVIGGHVVNTKDLAIKMVEAIVYYKKNKTFPESSNTLSTYLNWNAMKKYSIDLSKIPTNSIIINKPKSIFQIYYKEIIYLLIMVVILLKLTLYWLFKLKRLNKNMEKKSIELIEVNKNLEQFIDTQNNIAILSDGKNIKFVNKKFCDFLGFNNLEDFKKDHTNIAEFFIKCNRFFHLDKIKENENWLDKIKELPSSKRVVSMQEKNGKNHIFSVSINKFNNKLKIITFSDISETINENIKLEEKVIKDKLTNSYNREYFEINANKLIEKYIKGDFLIGFAILDIDNFKLVNDNYGHDIGDITLKHLVQTIDKYSREDDILIRWGGEEFLIILKIKSEKDLNKALENIRKTIELENFPIIKNLTCSIGASVYKEKEDIYKTIKRADIGLYEGKNNGRNTIIVK